MAISIQMGGSWTMLNVIKKKEQTHSVNLVLSIEWIMYLVLLALG